MSRATRCGRLEQRPWSRRRSAIARSRSARAVPLRGRNPSNRNRLVGRPDSTSAGERARSVRARPRPRSPPRRRPARAARPGSAMPGMPASLTYTTRLPLADRVDDAQAPRYRSLWPCTARNRLPAATPTARAQRPRAARVLGRDDVRRRAAPRPHAATGRRGCRSASPHEHRAQRAALRRHSFIPSPRRRRRAAAPTGRTRRPTPRSRSTNATPVATRDAATCVVWCSTKP